MPLTAERKCVIFLENVPLGRKTKPTDQSFSLWKIFSFYDNGIEITCKNQSIYQITVVLKIIFKRF